MVDTASESTSPSTTVEESTGRLIIADGVAVVGLSAFIWSQYQGVAVGAVSSLGALTLFAIGCGFAGGIAALPRKPPSMSPQFVIGGGGFLGLSSLNLLYLYTQEVVPGPVAIWVLLPVAIRIGYPLLLDEIEERDSN